MSTTLLILTICLYLTSLVGAILIGIGSKQFSQKAIRWPIFFHIALLTTALLLTFSEQFIAHYFILFAFCSGLLLSFWALRKKEYRLPVRIYFGAYLLSVLLFLTAPGKLFYLISGNIEQYKDERKIDLQDNYFLIEQRSLLASPNDPVAYKIIQQRGFYKKTLQRDIFFEDDIKSGKMILANADSLILDLTYKNKGKMRVGLKCDLSKNSIQRSPGKQKSGN